MSPLLSMLNSKVSWTFQPLANTSPFGKVTMNCFLFGNCNIDLLEDIFSIYKKIYNSYLNLPILLYILLYIKVYILVKSVFRVIDNIWKSLNIPLNSETPNEAQKRKKVKKRVLDGLVCSGNNGQFCFWCDLFWF